MECPRGKRKTVHSNLTCWFISVKKPFLTCSTMVFFFLLSLQNAVILPLKGRFDIVCKCVFVSACRCIYTCMCVSARTHACTHTHACVSSCVSHKLTSGVILQVLPTLFLRQGFSRVWSSPNKLGWFSSKPQRSDDLYFPSAGIKMSSYLNFLF